ncbi:MAG: hypothetical protein K6B72_03050 [Lachnospiraceae bacterium]|nr:hypothetical protein [Lachnospiraceae bacterium]
MKKKLLAVLMAGVLGAALLTGCGGNKDTKKEETKTEAADKTEDKAEAKTEEAADDAEGASEDGAAVPVTFVDGFYASNGSDDFVIAFYTAENGAELAYVNDGKNEVIAEYAVEKATLDDGTEYLVVGVGQTFLGYYEDEENVYLIDDEGNVYIADHLTEEEAETLAEIANS